MRKRYRCCYSIRYNHIDGERLWIYAKFKGAKMHRMNAIYKNIENIRNLVPTTIFAKWNKSLSSIFQVVLIKIPGM